MTLPSQSAGIHLGVFQGFIVTTDEDGMVPLNSRVLATIEPGATQFWIDLLAENSKLKGQLEAFAHAVEVVANSIAFVLPALPAKQRPALQAIEDELRAAIEKCKLKEAGS